jgi:polyisoprenoid-binding protein YceI
MKYLRLTSLLAAGLVVALPALADSYTARPGSSVKIDGTSTVHDWSVESKLIGGSMELKGDLNKPGKVDATARAIISVTSIKSDKKAKDDIMHAAMKAEEHKRIEFNLKELTAKGDMKFDAKGDLSLAGVTKEVNFPVTMEKADGDMMIVKGVLDTKMTDFDIDPPAPKVALGAISTGDEVKVTFEWHTRKK